MLSISTRAEADLTICRVSTLRVMRESYCRTGRSERAGQSRGAEYRIGRICHPVSLCGLFQHLTDGGQRQTEVLGDLTGGDAGQKGGPHRLALPLLQRG